MILANTCTQQHVLLVSSSPPHTNHSSPGLSRPLAREAHRVGLLPKLLRRLGELVVQQEGVNTLEQVAGHRALRRHLQHREEAALLPGVFLWEHYRPLAAEGGVTGWK